MESVVRAQFLLPVVLPVALWASLSLMAISTAHAIENDPAKEYHLTEKHGPWMVMVATFRDVREEEGRKTEGLKAEEAASKLVHELRASGIPAYTYSREAKKAKIDTFDRLGKPDKRVYAVQRDMICVLAGNYEKVEDPIAQKTLTYLKRYRPKFMSDPKSGAVVRDPSGSKGPFVGAFLTINPLRKPDEIVRKKADSVTKYLNSGIDNALVNLKSKYTLKVATFTGKSVVPLGNSKFKGHEGNFEKSLIEAGSSTLARAGEDAAQLTYALRQNTPNSPELGGQRFEAYVYHDKYQSIVTVGGFESMKDPEIRRLADVFHARYVPDEENGGYAMKVFNLYPDGNMKLRPINSWAFDPIPELIEVPRIK
jgi:hypothetical protein